MTYPKRVDALTNDSGLKVNKDSSGHVTPGAGLAEEGVVRLVAPCSFPLGAHLTVILDTVLQTVQFPAGIAHLDTGLADVDRDALALQGKTLPSDKDAKGTES
ncbi:hypothetical protein BaRGS_00020275 [Batillaria attramentaria]|uniref:Uncharacterized protein n=1 Tax=Batillaria attramentaria TaxID=370345 RepID=A0ABD0KMP3_9CAEN